MRPLVCNSWPWLLWNSFKGHMFSCFWEKKVLCMFFNDIHPTEQVLQILSFTLFKWYFYFLFYLFHCFIYTICTMWMQWPQKPEEDIGIPGTRIIESCEMLYGFWRWAGSTFSQWAISSCPYFNFIIKSF